MVNGPTIGDAIAHPEGIIANVEAPRLSAAKNNA